MISSNFILFVLLFIFEWVAPSTNFEIATADPSIIVFPDDKKVESRCEGQSTFCTETTDYPSTYLNSLFERGIIPAKRLVTDHVEVENITQRIDINDEFPLCGSRERLVYPVKGETENGDWFFIANTEKIKQGVRVEECLNRGSSCSLLGNGLKTKCVQKYVYRQMFALNGMMVQDMKFKIPSCCMCTAIPEKSRRQPPKRNRHVKRFASTDNTDEDISYKLFYPNVTPLATTRTSHIGHTIISPDPSCADGMTYCTAAPHYPTRHLRRLVASNKLKKIAVFGEVDPPADDFIATRVFQNTEIALCDSRMEKVYPVVAKSKENTWEYIVQYEDEKQEYVQAVHLEICIKPEETCKFEESFPKGYHIKCKQKYIYRQLLAISSTTGEPYLSHFQLPSCCVCQVASEHLK